METRPPTITRILVAIGFALSCFALALFLWITFGGPLPLKPEGYRFTVPFDEATQLAVESDVRISGVPVGKVKVVELADNGRADATIELDSRLRADPHRHPGDAAHQDAARGDLRRADPWGRAGPHPGGGRQAAGGPGRASRSSSTRSGAPSTPARATPSGSGCRGRRRRCAAAATTSRPRSPRSAPSPRRRTGCSACSTARAARSAGSCTTAARSSRRCRSARGSSAA